MRAFVPLCLAGVIATGCAAAATTERDEPSEPEYAAAEAALLESLTTFEVGTVDEIRTRGSIDVSGRDAVAMVDPDGDILVLHRKDPNNGCRLTTVGEPQRASMPDLASDAVLVDQCHGHAYDLEGRHVDPACPDTRLRRFDLEIVEGVVIARTGGRFDVDTVPCERGTAQH